MNKTILHFFQYLDQKREYVIPTEVVIATNVHSEISRYSRVDRRQLIMYGREKISSECARIALNSDEWKTKISIIIQHCSEPYKKQVWDKILLESSEPELRERLVTVVCQNVEPYSKLAWDMLNKDDKITRSELQGISGWSWGEVPYEQMADDLLKKKFRYSYRT